ncbi:MAG TPA: hypothetical protein VGG39_23145 [Polyangiaceae bacterium]
MPVEATQELQALDVLEIVETLKPKLGLGPRRPSQSNSSIAPVGLDLATSDGVERGDEEVNPTMEVRLPMRRRRLGVIVVATVAGCALILVAAGIARVSHASSPAATVSPSTAAAGTPDPSVPSTSATAAPAPVPPPSPAAPVTPSPTTSTGASTGTVRLDRPATPGRAWLDGKRLSSSSALVSCGTHQIKVGRGRTHSIDVPCGGEIGVAK